MEEPSDAPSTIADEAQHLHRAWDAPTLTAPKPVRRIGWIAVWIAAGVVISLGAREALVSSDIDPNDPGWGDIAFFVSPILAALAALVVGVVLIIVAGLGLVRITLRRALRATGAGMLGGAVLYVTLLVVGTYTLDVWDVGLALGFTTFLLPILCGVTITLVVAVVAR